MPAHSQFLAAASKMMQSLMCDCHMFSREQPLVLDEQLRGFSEADLQIFLNHVYLNTEVDSTAAADALLKVADLFDATKLMEKATTYLEEVPGSNMFANSSEVLRWLLLAERFNLALFLKKCANHAALQCKDVCSDARFHQLSPAALHAILQRVHLLTELYPGLQHGQSSHILCYPADYQSGAVPVVDVSSRHVTQSYMCRAVRMPHYNQVTALCGKHSGSWTWNLQSRVWQLDSKPTIVTRVLPGSVLELADLIGRPPCCTTSTDGKQWRSPSQGW